ncbi:MAG: Maltodextrin phosphorylase [Chlamydiae bacterium]|nr:Maltodextrin phosphorylase [Chlamydiota bacterium]
MDSDIQLFHPGMDKDSLKRAIINSLRYEESKDFETAVEEDYLLSMAWSIKHRLVDRWIETQKHYHEKNVKQVYYLSLEYLTGQAMKKNMINLNIYDSCKNALNELGIDMDEIVELEKDAALGNGGLGRLAACYLDSMSTMGLPAHGYGLRYEYGIFKQTIEKGYQVEHPDFWLKQGSLWDIRRPEHVYTVQYKGKVIETNDETGNTKYEWVDTEDVIAEAYDTPYVGYDTTTVNTLRLWSADAKQEFNLEYFNHGNYLQAVEERAISKSITRVLYPNDSIEKGVELRLYQEYFLVSATLQDIVSHFKGKDLDFNHFPDKVAMQLNDTHPSLAIPELMRILIDKEGLEWEKAWSITQKSFAYTNHTVLPEALERWPIKVLETILPRHLQIIYDINSHFLREVANHHQKDKKLLKRISIIEEGSHSKKVNMAHLSIVGSHHVNGVSELHTKILKDKIFHDFQDIFPDKFINVTNGITPRRWLKQCNIELSDLISSSIGKDWVKDLSQLKKLVPFTKKENFLEQWKQIKLNNKKKLADYIHSVTGVEVNPASLFDIQVKRIHQYKRQLLNILHVVALYNHIKANPEKEHVPRTVIFGGKAAPSYDTAKTIIKLINSIADVVNSDDEVNKTLKVIFIPDYRVSIAEKIMPATDLSEQISTAGYEASGTGNMKFALNGALTIGTLDGANIEMLEEVGKENIFIFGLKSDEVVKLKKHYEPKSYYEKSPILKEVLDLIENGYFNLEEPALFKPLIKRLKTEDPFCLLADFDAYIDCQKRVDEAYKDQKKWTIMSILNTAHMGKFSSDRAVMEYAKHIWKVDPFTVPPIKYDDISDADHNVLFS